MHVAHEAGTAIERCVGDPQVFVRDVWTREARRFPAADPDRYADVLTLEAVDTLIGTGGLRHPALRVVRDGESVPSSAYLTAHRTAGKRVADVIDPEAVLAAFGSGATLVLQALHRFHRPVQRFCDDLERFFGHPLQANAYLTPAGSRGLAVHHDTHDVLVLQLHGHKRWRLYATDVPDPIGTYPKAKRHRRPGAPTEALVLEPGDCLYLPRGVPHQAEGLASASLHLTLGIRSPTWIDVLERVMERARELPELRRSLPIRYGTHPGELEASLGSVLARTADWLRELDPGTIAADEVERARRALRPSNAGRLLALAGVVELDADSVLERATEVPWRIDVAGDHATLRAGKAGLRFPRRVLPALRRIEAQDRLRMSDLGDALDDAGKRVLLGRLLREGFVRAVPSDQR